MQHAFRSPKALLRRSHFAMLAMAVCFAVPCLASRTVVDEQGRRVNVPDHPHRIVCLVPSITDDIYSIGHGDDVVGITDYVEYPAAAKSKPNVGAIDNPSLEAILALHPDLVLGQPEFNKAATLDQLQKAGIPVFFIDPHGVNGILRSLASLGRATNHEADAQAEIDRLNARVAAVRARIKGLPVVDVFMPLSFDPIFSVGQGSFITEIIALAGGRSVTDDLRQEWPQVSLEAVVARAPQALVLMRDGKTTVQQLKERPGWSVLPAVQAGRAYFVDNRINLSSPIAFEEIEDLARQFHP